VILMLMCRRWSRDTRQSSCRVRAGGRSAAAVCALKWGPRLLESTHASLPGHSSGINPTVSYWL